MKKLIFRVRLLALGMGLWLPFMPQATADTNFVITGSLINARDSHTGTPLPNGKVLVAGGHGSSGPLASTELYDPATGTWTATGGMGTARYVHTATLLPTGAVLV